MYTHVRSSGESLPNYVAHLWVEVGQPWYVPLSKVFDGDEQLRLREPAASSPPFALQQTSPNWYNSQFSNNLKLR